MSDTIELGLGEVTRALISLTYVIKSVVNVYLSQELEKDLNYSLISKNKSRAPLKENLDIFKKTFIDDAFLSEFSLYLLQKWAQVRAIAPSILKNTQGSVVQITSAEDDDSVYFSGDMGLAGFGWTSAPNKPIQHEENISIQSLVDSIDNLSPIDSNQEAIAQCTDCRKSEASRFSIKKSNLKNVEQVNACISTCISNSEDGIDSSEVVPLFKFSLALLKKYKLNTVMADFYEWVITNLAEQSNGTLEPGKPYLLPGDLIELYNEANTNVLSSYELVFVYLLNNFNTTPDIQRDINTETTNLLAKIKKSKS